MHVVLYGLQVKNNSQSVCAIESIELCRQVYSPSVHSWYSSKGKIVWNVLVYTS